MLLFPFTKYLFVEGKKCPITIDDKLFKFWHFNRKKRKTLMTHAGVRAIGNADDKRSDKLCKTTLFPFHHTDLKLRIMIGNCWGKSRLIGPLSSNQYEFQIAWFFTLFKHCHLHLHYIRRNKRTHFCLKNQIRVRWNWWLGSAEQNIRKDHKYVLLISILLKISFHVNKSQKCPKLPEIGKVSAVEICSN